MQNMENLAVLLFIVMSCGRCSHAVLEEVLMYEPSGSSSSGTTIWSSNWYFTNQWNYALQWNNVKLYSYCYILTHSPPSWLRTDYIDVKDSTLIHVTVTFKMYVRCIAGYWLPDCKKDVALHQYQRDTPAEGGGTYDFARPDKFPGNFVFVQAITGTKSDTSLDTVSVSIPVTKKGVYLAIKAIAGCLDVNAVKVTFQSCPEKVINLVKFNKTKTQSLSVTVQGVCTQGSSSSQSLHSLECKANGTWNLSGSNAAICICNPGFQNNQEMTACEACPVDQYKAASGNTKCTACPGNSWTNNMTGQTSCVCKNHFYRASLEDEHAECSGSYD